MRTTLEIPDDLLEEAQRLFKFKSKTDTVIASLRELIRKSRIESLKAMSGAIDLRIDVSKSRRRPKVKRLSADKMVRGYVCLGRLLPRTRFKVDGTTTEASQ